MFCVAQQASWTAFLEIYSSANVLHWDGDSRSHELDWANVYEKSFLGGSGDMCLNIVNGDFGIIDEIICIIVVILDLSISIIPAIWTNNSPSSSLSPF